MTLRIQWMLLLVAASLVGAAEKDAFPIRSMTDTAKRAHALGLSTNTKAVVFVYLGPECPISQRYIPELNRIATEQGTNGVEFYGVMSGKSVKRSEARDFVKDYALKFPVLYDEKLTLAKWLRPTHMPEAFVLRPDGTRLYHGRIDDWYQAPGKPRARAVHYELRDAIHAALAGRKPAVEFAQPVGCYFEDLPR